MTQKQTWLTAEYNKHACNVTDIEVPLKNNRVFFLFPLLNRWTKKCFDSRIRICGEIYTSLQNKFLLPMDICTRLHVLHVNFGYIFLECDQIIVPVYSLNIAELGRPVTGMITQVNLARKEDCSQISQYRNTSCLKMRRKILLSSRSEIRRLKNCPKRLNNDWLSTCKMFRDTVFKPSLPSEISI